MLLNLSNHPATGWSAAQCQAARALFDTVEDLPFPAIPPAWNAVEVAALAGEYAFRCQATLAEQAEAERAVHVMGETQLAH